MMMLVLLLGSIPSVATLSVEVFSARRTRQRTATSLAPAVRRCCSTAPAPATRKSSALAFFGRSISSSPAILNANAISEDGSYELPNRNISVSASSQQVSEHDSKRDTTATTADSGRSSYRRLLSYILATVLIWVLEPLQSLVDTAAVARCTSSLVQVAALGPATTFCDFLIYLTYFLAMATTNQVASALASTQAAAATAAEQSDEGDKETVARGYAKLQRITSNVLVVAGLLGLVLSVFVWTLGRRVLETMVGGSSATAERLVLLRYASSYVWIRATSLSASILNLVAEAFLLSTLNTRTPLLAMATAFGTNVVGDVLLTPVYGVVGAAVATATASLASCALLLRAVWRQLSEWKAKELSFGSLAATKNTRLRSSQAFDVSKGGEQESSGISAAPPATNKTKKKPNNKVALFSLPNRRDSQKLLTLAGPLFFVNLAVMTCYSAMTVKCSNFGVAALATHSILEGVFFLFGCFGDAISQAAQSFLPQAVAQQEHSRPQRTNKTYREKRMHQTSLWRRLLAIAICTGLVNSQVSTRIILRYFGEYLSSGHGAGLLPGQHSSYLGGALVLHPTLLLLEGTLLASSKLKLLLSTYAVTVSFLAARLQWACPNLSALWQNLFFFQLFRLVSFFSCVVWLGNNNNNNNNHGGSGSGDTNDQSARKLSDK